MIEIVDYKDSWPSEFQVIGSRLREVLGPVANRIDHIGSTSVPGLAAKDIIDIQITVNRLNDNLIARLQSIGYQHVDRISRDHTPPLFPASCENWEKLFFRPPKDQRPTNTHVRMAGKSNQRFPLLFRDYLRAHPASARAYANLKKQLATNLSDPDAYPTVKDPAVDLIYFAAEEWATINDWQPADSDI